MSNGKNNYVRFKTNIPEIVTFKFDTPKEFEGKFGKQYSYGVEWKGQDAYMSTTEILSDKLQKIGNLRGKTLEIEKVEGDGGRKYWVIKENGQEIDPKSLNNIPRKDFQAGMNAIEGVVPEDKLNQIRVAFKSLEKRIEILEGMQEAKALEFHTITHDHAKKDRIPDVNPDLAEVE